MQAGGVPELLNGSKYQLNKKRNYMEKDSSAKKDLSEVLLEQILDIRDSGETNMLDKNTVQRIANDKGYYQLVCFIEDHPEVYVRFILCGDATLL